ncbi:phosphoadenosine phosphosulfate reductase family protein [Aureimonas sp. Leaf324]|uniref:phosphoadenosine phosphosulfate reductase domain-containing protein n=1 Tax=Aureimonas sp. Leaf324 TaxID=1736336 RepID=UPI00070049FD|nr:phosphoadenosine phosphosulfate reductase family protein [Aureimonas sp. Leaf324]KQQ90971.1 hypothetical protein ASF65_00050 [Aureimonas sp. Leaf324]
MRLADAEVARLHSRSDRYRRKLEVALEIARTGVEKAGGTAFVAFSCGKDSAATLSIAQEVLSGVEGRMIRWPESRWIDDFDRVLSDYEGRGVTIRVLDLCRDSLDDRVPERWRLMREMEPAGGQFVGLRADECKARRRTLAMHGPVYRTQAEGYVRICPIAWWTVLDVSARIWTHDLPILSTYETDIRQRTVARVPRGETRDAFALQVGMRDPQSLDAIRRIYPADEI